MTEQIDNKSNYVNIDGQNPLNDSSKEKKMPKFVSCLTNAISGFLIVIEWIVGLAIAITPDQYFHEDSYKQLFWNVFGDNIGRAIIDIFILLIVIALSIFLFRKLIGNIAKKAVKNTISTWIANNASSVIKWGSYVVVALEWAIGMIIFKMSFLIFIILIIINALTIALIIYLMRKINKENIYKLFKWCSQHIGWTITIIASVAILMVPLFVDFDELKEKRAERRVEKSIQSGNPRKVMDVVENLDTCEYRAVPIMTLLVEANYIDAAEYFYKHRTPNYSYRDSDWRRHYCREIERNGAKILYEAYINQGNMEKAWEYYQVHFRLQDTRTYYEDYQCYYNFMNEVIKYYCENGDKISAQRFLTQHLMLFISEVDNNPYVLEHHPEYQSEKVKERLQEQINNY